MTYSKIVGTGRYLPEQVLTNFDLEKMVDTNDEWIRTRTGVERRHCVAPDQTTSDMCVEAAKVAIEDAGIEPSDIDMVVIGTTSPDLIFPNAATLVQHRLGIPACPCIATEEACTSFIYGLVDRRQVYESRVRLNAFSLSVPSALPSSSTGVTATPVCYSAMVRVPSS